jgi:sorbitol/mannitol transport system permease protein
MAVTMDSRIGRAQAPTISRREKWSRRLPLIPAFVFVFALTQIPFLITIGVSFMNWNANYPAEIGFAGLSNYIEVFSNSALRIAVINSALYTVVVVLVSLLLGLGIALLLNQRFRGRAIVRTLMIAPFLIVPVAAALLWKHVMLNPDYGLINGVFTWIAGIFGQPAPQPSWVTDFPQLSIEIALIWQWTPFMMLIILAGLQSQPADVLEAAQVDGAGRWRTFISITFPHVRRYIELAALLGSIYIIQNFDAVFTLTGGAFDTANLPYTIYRTFFTAQDYGLASAMGVVTVAGTIVLVTLFLRGLTSLNEGMENR